MADNLVNILFRFHNDILDEDTTETLHGEVIDNEKGYYKLETIPFHAPLVALGDIVFAKYDNTESILIYRETIKYSGNSTIHVIIMDDNYDIDAIREIFEEPGAYRTKIATNILLQISPPKLTISQLKATWISWKKKMLLVTQSPVYQKITSIKIIFYKNSK